MLLDFKKLIEKYDIPITGIIQIGSNYAQEDELFNNIGIQNKIYIEPCQKAFKFLKEKFNQVENVTLFNVACGEKKEFKEMFVESQNGGASNSFLKPKLHTELFPHITFEEKEMVEVVKLDDLTFDRTKYSILMMDCQGAEGFIIKGGTETLKTINFVYTEVLTAELYEDNFLINDLDVLLSDFKRAETSLTNFEYGDALYVRKNKKIL